MSVVFKADSTSPLSLSMSGSTTCASLLRELQEIWDEIGESETDRDKALLDLEQQCLDIYRKRVESTRKHKADLRQALADAEAEIAQISSALGEVVSLSRDCSPLSLIYCVEKTKTSVKQQLSIISPIVGNLRRKKDERYKEISETEFQIARISLEIAGNDQIANPNEAYVDDSDLTTRRLGELKSHLKELQFEKNMRVQKVNGLMKGIHELAVVMSLDFKTIMARVHPSLVDTDFGQAKSITDDTLAGLTSELNLLRQEKRQRLLKVQDFGRALIKLWDLLDMSMDERRKFDNVTCLMNLAADEVASMGCLSIDVIEQVELEVDRLNFLKANKMKELILNRQSELEQIYKKVHMEIDGDRAREMLISLMESETCDLSGLLASMDDEIAKANALTQSRKDILDKVEKWRHAAEEERWLEEYERDENRYSAGRGVHKTLKRAEKARILINKIPSLLESLTAKVKAWESEKGMPFLYYKAPLLETLEQFMISRQEKEEEKRKTREQKKLQDQLAIEQETRFGSKSNAKKPSSMVAATTPSRQQRSRNANAATTPSAPRLGVSSHGKGGNGRYSGKVDAVIPVNYVALPKDDNRIG